MSWLGRRNGKKARSKAAGQVSYRTYLETGNWRTKHRPNTYRHSNDPRFQAALKSHEAALRELDAALGVAAGQENLIDLLISLGDETDGGLWTP